MTEITHVIAYIRDSICIIKMGYIKAHSITTSFPVKIIFLINAWIRLRFSSVVPQLNISSASANKLFAFATDNSGSYSGMFSMASSTVFFFLVRSLSLSPISAVGTSSNW